MTLARERGQAFVLLLAMAALLAAGVAGDGLTHDELIYIAAGHRHLGARDFAINSEQPPLAKMAAALPLLALSLREPPRAGDREEWAYRFLHVENDAARVIPLARLPVVLMTLGLAVWLWRWTRAEHGPLAGLLALALAAFHTTFLAHGHLATTDVPSTLAMVAASWAYWRWSRAPSLRGAAGVGLALGVALATRLTAGALVVVFAVLEVAALASAPKGEGAGRARWTLVVTVAALVMVPLVVWAAHGFRYAPLPGESIARPVTAELGLAGRVADLAMHARLLPEAYLEGARYQIEHNVAGHPMYMLGRTDMAAGPRYYYALAFAVKNTPGFLLASIVALYGLCRREAWAATPVARQAALAAALLFAAVSLGRVQIGERYIVAVYPYLILLGAPALAALAGKARVIAVLAIAAHAAPAILQTPRGHIPYFNVLGGGTDGGHRILADSNLDWGQDLPRLAAWMRASGVEEIQLAYHGADDPARFGIRHTDLPGLHHYPSRPPERLYEGTFVLSPNMLLGLYQPPGENPYASLLARPPDARAGVYFIYRD